VFCLFSPRRFFPPPILFFLALGELFEYGFSCVSKTSTRVVLAGEFPSMIFYRNRCAAGLYPFSSPGAVEEYFSPSSDELLAL